MEILIGVFLTVLTALVGDVIHTWLKARFPRIADRKVAMIVFQPFRYLRHRRKGREPLVVIDRLFRAWESKDEAAYEKCWHPDATRIVGEYSQRSVDRNRIFETFRQSCARYSRIQVDYLTKESIEVAPDGTKATVDVRYGFTVERPDALKVQEHGRERYGLIFEKGKWSIASNWDRSEVS